MADVQCENCGAHVAAHAALCEFCQSPLGRAESSATPSHADAAASLPGLQKLYNDGKIQAALTIVNNLQRQSPDVEKDVSFLLLHAKLLLETEGATGQIKLLLNKAFVLAPKNPDIVDYQGLAEAKEKLDLGLKQTGEDTIRAVLKRKPNHPHALLLMGTHLFWGRDELDEAARYLENCVRVRPVMLRAWACLGAVYATLDNKEKARRALTKALELETNGKMIEYLRNLMKNL